ncbi:MAG TPA: secondary thiamine-phosphate synthase [Gammaproteobacteria bacterium]|jgi:secondary thiamine-phosphate synthase enzyme|nr:secondary thiamine-phosphate synthase enzyme YjbQ [Arenicellales bacterium]MDP6854319.1 secondary thiamine-phosphate synthase enzyme YjbQ [Arenicellales bacterium]MDP6948134.1 secondary thiamine-phosphate synthase enzyme YjbQ [Arenicellales bacterium]HCY13832.1 secondary thiamine-phosphate synthase [Gammaproteobacteria bacterium]|tara:strand:- start:942 stop:1373 length:432 start_codon:yes stop_codon:yes gene_type:complete
MTQWFQQELRVDTGGRETRDITEAIMNLVDQSGVRTGLCHIFIRHTSASLAITENADPAVRHDLEIFMQTTVADGNPRYTHTSEGDDDMSAHLRSLLTDTAVTVPVSGRRLALGTWQGIYLWEHRTRPQRRTVVVTVWGEGAG